MGEHGGRRKGAGRPPGSSKPSRAKAMSLRLPLTVRERLDAVCASMGLTHAEVMALGVATAEERLAARQAGK